MTIYIPDRLDEGYGLNTPALDKLRAEGAALVVTVDCGITGVAEADFARDIGLDLVITDHHECQRGAASGRRRGGSPPAGLPLSLQEPGRRGRGAEAGHGSGGAGEGGGRLPAATATLAAIGTVADVMQHDRGKPRHRPLRPAGCCPNPPASGCTPCCVRRDWTGKAVTSTSIGFVLSPRINAAGRMGQADTAAELFLTGDRGRAEELAQGTVRTQPGAPGWWSSRFSPRPWPRIAALPEASRSALVLESDTWHQGVVGIVASRLSEKYSCPSFMIHLSGEVGKGSCRSFGGFNLFAALEQCQELLLGFGGHELAAGFTIEKENIPAFREKMNECVRRSFGAARPVSCLEVDAVITRPSLLSLGEVEALSALEPYGADNPRPLFCIQGLTVDSLQNVGQNRHLKLRFSKGSVQLDGIFFSATAETCGAGQGDRVDAAFYLNVNEFRSRCTVQLQLADLRLSREPSVPGTGRSGTAGPPLRRPGTDPPGGHTPAARTGSVRRLLARAGSFPAPGGGAAGGLSSAAAQAGKGSGRRGSLRTRRRVPAGVLRARASADGRDRGRAQFRARTHFGQGRSGSLALSTDHCAPYSAGGERP